MPSVVASGSPAPSTPAVAKSSGRRSSHRSVATRALALHWRLGRDGRCLAVRCRPAAGGEEAGERRRGDETKRGRACVGHAILRSSWPWRARAQASSRIASTPMPCSLSPWIDRPTPSPRWSPTGCSTGSWPRSSSCCWERACRSIVAGPAGERAAMRSRRRSWARCPRTLTPVELAGGAEEFEWLPEAVELGWRRERNVVPATGRDGSRGRAPARRSSSRATSRASGPRATGGERARLAIRALAVGYGLHRHDRRRRTSRASSSGSTGRPSSTDEDERSRLGRRAGAGRGRPRAPRPRRALRPPGRARPARPRPAAAAGRPRDLEPGERPLRPLRVGRPPRARRPHRRAGRWSWSGSRPGAPGRSRSGSPAPTGAEPPPADV